MYDNITIEVLKCLNKDEDRELFNIFKNSNTIVLKGDEEVDEGAFRLLMADSSSRVATLDLKNQSDYSGTIEAWLEESGIPFKEWKRNNDSSISEIDTFDGVRRNTVNADRDGNPLVDMRVLRSIIDMLEDDDEIRAIPYANMYWVETDVSNMWRWGMEEVREFSTDQDKETIDVDIVEEESDDKSR